MAYRLLTGIGLGGAIPPAVALCGEYAPKKWRSSFITYSYVGLTIGLVSAGWVSLWLLKAHGWQSVLVFGGVVAFFYALLMWAFMPELLEFRIRNNFPQAGIAETLLRIDPLLVIDAGTRIVVAPHASQGASVGRLFHHDRGMGTAMIWLCLFMNLFVLFFFQNWLPSIFGMTGLTQDQSISATSTALSGGFIAAFVLGPLMDRFGSYRVMGLLFLASAAFVAGTGLFDRTYALMLSAAFCAGFSLSGIQKCANALCVFFYPVSLRSTGLGWGLGIGRAGAILGPAVAGNMFQAHWAVTTVFYTFAVPMLVGSASMLVMGRYDHGGRAEDRVAVALTAAKP